MNLYKVEYKYDGYMGRCTRTRYIVSDDVADIENILKLNFDTPSLLKVELTEENILIGGYVKEKQA